MTTIIAGLQDRLISERMAVLLKRPNCNAHLKRFFSMDIEYDLTDMFDELCQGFAVVLSYKDILDLSERVDLASTVQEMLKKHLPDHKTKQKGTQCGNILLSFPNGKKLIADFDEHLQQANLTQQGLSCFDEKVTACSTQVQAVSDFKVLGVAGLADITQNMFSLSKCLASGFTSCLAEFSPGVGHESVIAVSGAWLTLLLRGWQDVLQPVASTIATSDLLALWVDGDGEYKGLLAQFFDESFS